MQPLRRQTARGCDGLVYTYYAADDPFGVDLEIWLEAINIDVLYDITKVTFVQLYIQKINISKRIHFAKCGYP